MLLKLVFVLFLEIAFSYSQCGNGYVDYENANKCVKVIRNGKKFTDAMMFCMGDAPDHHGTLVSVHSQAQNNQLAELASVTTCTDYEVWIGFAYTHASSGYEWTDGSDVDFLNWVPGHPHEEGQDAMAYLTPAESGKWYSTEETDTKKCFVCQYDRNSPPGTPAAPTTTKTLTAPVSTAVTIPGTTGTVTTATGNLPQSTRATNAGISTSEKSTGNPYGTMPATSKDSSDDGIRKQQAPFSMFAALVIYCLV